MKPKWLTCSGPIELPPFILCFTQAEFDTTLKNIGAVGFYGHFCNADARTWFPENSKGQTACVVTIRTDKGRHPCQLAACLVHEAVHIFQHYCEVVGEDSPSMEFEAYSVQWISQQLFYEFTRRMK